MHFQSMHIDVNTNTHLDVTTLHFKNPEFSEAFKMWVYLLMLWC